MAFLSSVNATNVYGIAAVIVVLIAYLFKRSWNKHKNLPPGPTGLPILGYIPFLGPEPYKSFNEMRKEYGDIIGIKFGSNFVVILNEYDVMKETLNHPAALDREQYLFGSMPIGFLAANGPRWIEERRFCMHAMRNLGFGRKRWEEIIEDSVLHFIENINPHEGKPTDITEHLHVAISNNIIALLIGRKLHTISEKEKIKLFTQYSDVFLNYVRTFRAESVVPGFRTICESLRIAGYGRAAKIISSFIILVKDEINKHRSIPDYAEKEDFINTYEEKMKYMETRERKHIFNDHNLLGDVSILFLASSDTVYSSTGWIIRLMAAYPEVQQKVQQEIDEIIGSDGTLNFDDRNKMPYTLAVMMESQRFSSIVPLSTTRVANQDFEIRGYTIPKGSMIMGNLWAIHHDTTYWKNPDLFKPERFLTSDGKVIKNSVGYAPFSLGRRNCPGETMAYMVILLFITKLLQKFTISIPPGEKPKFDVEGGLVQYLTPQNLCFMERT